MPQHLSTDNSSSFGTVAALALAAGVAFATPALPLKAGGTGTSVFSVENESASASWWTTPAEAEIESPDFVPVQLVQFAARGYVRRNRWP
jgi:hypothetical protein